MSECKHECFCMKTQRCCPHQHQKKDEGVDNEREDGKGDSEE